jgi:thiamine kinase-like enzyme
MIGPLSGGRSNRSFLLEADGSKMVLRLNATDTLLPGANRNHEIEIWQAASQLEIAPPLLHVDEKNRFLVSRYINNSLTAQASPNEAFVEQAFDLLERCHPLELDTPGIDYISHIEQYWQAIENQGGLQRPALHDQREPMRRLLETLINSGAQTGLCHHDPVITNFVGNPDRLYLIDWEYAARGLRVMDYAALGVEWGIDEALIITRMGLEPELLSMAKTWYGYLCDLWAACSSPR